MNILISTIKYYFNIVIGNLINIYDKYITKVPDTRLTNNLTCSEELLIPIYYMLEMPNKSSSRTKMVEKLSYQYNITIEDKEFIIDTVEKIHNISLVIDDIQDNSSIRRNNVSSHIKYGVPWALASSYMLCFDMIYNSNYKYKNKNLKVIDLIIKVLYNIHKGQLQEIYWSNNNIIPSIDEYKEMAIGKTGSPFIFIADMLYELSNNLVKTNFSEEMGEFAYLYQKRNDLKTYTDKNKDKFEDIKEGKKSYPIIILINDNPDQKEYILDLLNHRRTDSQHFFDLISTVVEQESKNIDLEIDKFVDKLPKHLSQLKKYLL